VSPGYFETAGCALVEGRGFRRGDGRSRRAVLVNEAFQRRVFGGRSPVGKYLRPSGFREWFEVAGVLRDDESANVYSNQPFIYSPYMGSSSVTYMVRTAWPAERLLPEVKQLVRKEAPDVPVYELNTLEARFAEASREERVMSAVLCASALLTIALAVVGVYGVMSYVVSRRQREIGVRMALGATGAMMLSMVMKEVVRITIVGTIAGVCLAVLLSWPLSEGGAGLGRVEEAPMGAAAMAVVALAALLAGLAPALRATRIDRAVALRDE